MRKIHNSNDIYCMKCGKTVCSHTLPEDAVIRAWIECPECSTISAPFCPIIDRCCVGSVCPSYIPDRKPYPYESPFKNDDKITSALKKLIGLKPIRHTIWVARPSHCNFMVVDLTTEEQYWLKYEGYEHY